MLQWHCKLFKWTKRYIFKMRLWSSNFWSFLKTWTLWNRRHWTQATMLFWSLQVDWLNRQEEVVSCGKNWWSFGQNPNTLIVFKYYVIYKAETSMSCVINVKNLIWLSPLPGWAGLKSTANWVIGLKPLIGGLLLLSAAQYITIFRSIKLLWLWKGFTIKATVTTIVSIILTVIYKPA